MLLISTETTAPGFQFLDDKLDDNDMMVMMMTVMITKSKKRIIMSHYNLLPSKMVYCIFSVALQAEEDLLLGREGKGALLESRTRVSHVLYQYCRSYTTFTLEPLAT